MAFAFPVVPPPLLRAALAARMRRLVVEAMRFMLPDESAPVALVFVRGRLVGFTTIEGEAQQFLQGYQVDRLSILAIITRCFLHAIE